MVLDSETESHLRTLHFDGKVLELDPEEETFFKAETGIQDPKELRKHVIKVHEEAYEVGVCSFASVSILAATLYIWVILV